jgi:hypothetical protein
MSIQAAIYHLTHYKYDRPVVLGPQIIRLRPAPHSRTRVISHSLKVTPANHFVNHQQDPYGNWMNARLQREIGYIIRMEPGVQSREETSPGPSSCRDTGWLLVQILRHLGFAARFVSGYLIQLKPIEKPLEGPAGPDARLHRPARLGEVYIPGRRLDRPRPDLGPADRRRPYSRSPARRITVERRADRRRTGKGRSRIRVRHAVDARREIRASPSPFPMSNGPLESVGERRRARCTLHDVRLTMGGEPTFVSIDDFESGEWNTDAVGPTKRDLADQLIRRLREKFAPNGFLHHGQGKWYPGESLPRWTFSLYWRRDGKPIWRDLSLIAEEGDRKPAKQRRMQAGCSLRSRSTSPSRRTTSCRLSRTQRNGS